MALTAALLPIVALLGACALATFNEEDYLVTCSFAGRTDKPCGQCIATSCQAPVNACCADETCKKQVDDGFLSSSSYGDRAVLQELDACAQGGSCRALEENPGGQAIVACIQASCQASCDLWRKSSLRPEASSCVRDPGTTYSYPSCTCTVPAKTEGAPTTPNAISCNRRTVSNGVCCASKDWPAPASTCKCKVSVCQTSGDSCRCGTNFGSSSNDEGVNACARGSCCIGQNGECACGNSLYCSERDVLVAQCTPSAVVCGGSERTVDSCSTK